MAATLGPSVACVYARANDKLNTSRINEATRFTQQYNLLQAQWLTTR
jgi:hypothetical protein